jgi:hypothetical protein
MVTNDLCIMSFEILLKYFGHLSLDSRILKMKKKFK